MLIRTSKKIPFFSTKKRNILTSGWGAGMRSVIFLRTKQIEQGISTEDYDWVEKKLQGLEV